jgi:adenine-specific DNA methylase
LLPDPLDPLCPDSFINILKDTLAPLEYSSSVELDRKELQKLLLSYIADFSQWEMGSNEQYVLAAKRLISAANPQNKPIILDSFSGNGSIPGEALRLGNDSIALELNPVANLILKLYLNLCLLMEILF